MRRLQDAAMAVILRKPQTLLNGEEAKSSNIIAFSMFSCVYTSMYSSFAIRFCMRGDKCLQRKKGVAYYVEKY